MRFNLKPEIPVKLQHLQSYIPPFPSATLHVFPHEQVCQGSHPFRLFHCDCFILNPYLVSFTDRGSVVAWDVIS
jgi:hypothetical protein